MDLETMALIQLKMFSTKFIIHKIFDKITLKPVRTSTLCPSATKRSILHVNKEIHLFCTCVTQSIIISYFLTNCNFNLISK